MAHQSAQSTSKTSNLIKFDLSKPEFNQETYSGRFLTLFKTQNPFFTFASTSRIKAAQKLIDEHLGGENNSQSPSSQLVTPERANQLRKAQYLVNSSVHPDSKEILNPIQRFCSFTIMNIPILFGMILSKQTTGNIVFWQWINQTYNANINYSNRNASSELGVKGLMLAYTGAVTSSIGIGLGMKRLLAPYSNKFKSPAAIFFNFLINVTAVGSAGVINVLIMRSSEMKEGIQLTDAQGKEVGKSPIVGRDAVCKTALSRIVLSIPTLLLPTIAFFLMEKKNLIPKARVARILTESTVFFLSMIFAPPMCCALFKQNCEIEVTKLEEKFHHLIDVDGKPIAELYYNKGL